MDLPSACGLSLGQPVEATLCCGAWVFSLQWLLLMGSTDSRRVGISNCGSSCWGAQTLWVGITSCGSSCWGAQTLGMWASLVVAPPVGEHRLCAWASLFVAPPVGEHRLCAWASLVVAPHLPGPGIKPVSPALAGGFLPHCTTSEIPQIFFLSNKYAKYFCGFMMLLHAERE